MRRMQEQVPQEVQSSYKVCKYKFVHLLEPNLWLPNHDIIKEQQKTAAVVITSD